MSLRSRVHLRDRKPFILIQCLPVLASCHIEHNCLSVCPLVVNWKKSAMCHARSVCRRWRVVEMSAKNAERTDWGEKVGGRGR